MSEANLKVVLNGERNYIIKVKEVYKDGRYLLIDGSIVEPSEIKEIIKIKQTKKK